jgi:hypothetical protein
LCDKVGLHDEFDFLKATFKENGCSQKQIRCAVTPLVRTCKPTGSPPHSPSYCTRPVQKVSDVIFFHGN